MRYPQVQDADHRNLQLLLSAGVIWGFAITTIKGSILYLYHRIFFVDRKLRIALWAVGIFVVCFCFVQSLASVLACLPVSAHYTLNKPHYCVNRRLAGTIISAFNVVSEFVILCLPLPALYKMHTPRRQKMGIMGIFMTGGL